MRARPRASPALAGPLRLRSEVARSLVRVGEEVERGLAHSVLPEDVLHSLHQDLRRLASGLAVWGRLVPAREEAAVEEVAQRLRRLARLVGRVRDRDVTMELLARGGRGAASAADREAWRSFLGRLREDGHTDRELLRAFLTTERASGLLDRARGALSVPPRLDATRGLSEILGKERHLRQGRVRRARRKARRRPTIERLHRLRIRIRQWRHLASIETAAGAAIGRPPPQAWRQLQARLGRLHDLDVALTTVPDVLAESAQARRLKTARRTLREGIRRSLERLGVRTASLAPTRRRARAA